VVRRAQPCVNFCVGDWRVLSEQVGGGVSERGGRDRIDIS
jgi:hypothetical protein